MKAMVLAAGLGTRLRPLTDDVPKPLLPVAGRPMIAYPLLQLHAAGVEDVVVNVHHHAEQVRTVLGDGSAFGVRLHYSIEETLLDTGGGLERARAWLGDDTFLVLNADSAHDVPLRAVADFHREKGALVTMVLRPDPQALRYGLIEIDRQSRIRRFLGEPRVYSGELCPLMYAGVCVFEPRVFQFMEPGCYGLTRETLPRLLRAGEPLFGYRYEAYWRVLDTPGDLEAGRREIEGGQPLSYVPRGSPTE